jgi:hypothetical protein
MSVVLGIVLGVCMFAFAVLQLYAGHQGISITWGPWWAFGALALALLMRITLPLSIGCFFFAREVWDWHWSGALLFAAPGLLFMVPGVFAAIVSLFKRERATGRV